MCVITLVLANPRHYNPNHGFLAFNYVAKSHFHTEMSKLHENPKYGFSVFVATQASSIAFCFLGLCIPLLALSLQIPGNCAFSRLFFWLDALP